MISMNMIDNTNNNEEFKTQPSYREKHKRMHLSDLIGNFGYFQFCVTLFSALRETIVAFDVVLMSSLLSKEHKLSSECCQLWNNLKTNESFAFNQSNESLSINYMANCSHINESNSMISKWNMQCNENTDWYIALIETAYLVGFIPGNLILGYCSDRYGRTRTYLISHIIALIGGTASVLVSNYWLFVISRLITATGSCGFNIIFTISLELVGIKYRAINTLINHFGWGLGVCLIPVIVHMFSSNYQYILAFCPSVSALMLFWALILLPESPLWLMTNEKYSEARLILKNIVRFNFRNETNNFEKNLQLFVSQMKDEKTKSTALINEDAIDTAGQKNELSDVNSKQKHRLLFSNPILRRDTIILAYTGFVAALFYYILAMNFSYVQKLSPEANFVSTGVGEWIGVLICIVLLRCSTRKVCFILSFSSLFSSFMLQAILAFCQLDNRLLVTLTNGIGSIFTCSLIFLIAMVSMEVLPTNLRNVGGSIIDTMTHVGSACAPFAIQLQRVVGNYYADSFYAFISLLGALFICKLTKTDHLELSDV